MTERRKRLLRWLGYPALATLTFVFALHFTFPYDRVRDRLVDLLSKEFDVAVAGVSPGWFPGRVRIDGLSLTTHAKRDDEKPRTLVIERIDLSLGLLSLLGRTVSVDVDAALGGGKLVGNVSQSPSALEVDLRTEGVSLESVPGLEAITGGAPIVGPFVAHVKLDLPKGKWAGAGGDITFSCAGCTIGDGVSKIRPPNASQQNAFSNEGFTLPRIRLGDFKGRVQIAKGNACIETFEARGGDIDVFVEGGVKFADPFKDSQAQLQARLRSSEEFKRASVRNSALFTGIRDAEGFIAYQAVGARSSLMSLKWLEARSAFTPPAECRGVAAPPAPAAKVARGTSPPANPIPPATPARDGVQGTATATPPAQPVATPAPGTPEAPPPPPANGGAVPSPEPTPPPPPAPSPTNDLIPSATPPPPETAPPAPAPEAQPPAAPAVEGTGPPPAPAEQPQVAPEQPLQPPPVAQ